MRAVLAFGTVTVLAIAGTAAYTFLTNLWAVAQALHQVAR